MQDEYKRTDKINRVCITCGSKFIVQFQAVESGGGLFCSRNYNPKIAASNSKKVKNKLGKTNDIVGQNCIVCNKLFQTKVKNINRGGVVSGVLKYVPIHIRRNQKSIIDCGSVKGI